MPNNEANAPLMGYTITKEKKFTGNTRNKSFYRENDCIDYIIKANNDANTDANTGTKLLYLFGEDINSNFSKRYFAIDRDTICKLAMEKKYHMYE